MKTNINVRNMKSIKNVIMDKVKTNLNQFDKETLSKQ